MESYFAQLIFFLKLCSLEVDIRFFYFSNINLNIVLKLKLSKHEAIRKPFG